MAERSRPEVGARRVYPGRKPAARDTSSREKQVDEFLFDDDDAAGETPNIKQLREALKKATKELKDLRAENQKLVTSTRTNVVRDVLKEKGVRESLARHVLRDLDDADVTPDAVGKWLEENAEDFGITLSDTPAADDSAGPSLEDAAALQAMSAVQSGAVTPVGYADLMARLSDPDISLEDLNKLTGLAITNS